MKPARQVRREAKQLFRLCLVDGKLDEGRARLAVQEVLRSRRRGSMALLGQFLRLLKFDYARRTAEIQSAMPLPADLRAQVQTGIEGVYGPGINALFAQNPALIGGMRIKVGSDVYDGSVQAELAALAKNLGITGANGGTSR